MQWWNEFLTWFNSGGGRGVLLNAGLPFVAIIIAGLVAAAIGRGSTKRLLTLNDRENRVSAVATMIGAARRASVWNTLSTPEQQHADHVASEADVRIRLLAVAGSGLAADWAAHEIASMKANSVSFSFQAEQSLIEFRDRMVTWQAKPARARKLFKNDLDLWAYEKSKSTNDVVTKQQAWAAAQVAAGPGPDAPAHAVSGGSNRVSLPDGASQRPVAYANQATPAIQTPVVPSSATPAPVVPPAPATNGGPVETPALVEPRDGSHDDRGARTTGGGHGSSGRHPDASDDEDSDDRIDDVVYSPPVNANAVTKRDSQPNSGDRR